MIVMNWTLALKGRLAMYTTARATSSLSILGSTITSPLAWGLPLLELWTPSIEALPMSICPQAMSYLRPSSEVALVSPVRACLVAV
jgi:hypothetical protein